MATPLDLQEQEQLDSLKAFWARYGNLITVALIVAFGALAAFNAWNWWQREQAIKAAGLFDQLDAAAQAGDTARVARAFADLKDRYGRTAFAEQGGLLAAKTLFDKGDAAAAREALWWVADNAVEDEYRTIARLRLAGVLADEKQYDVALKQLEGATSKPFEGLVADRRGDILLAQGKRDEARAAFRKAWDSIDADVKYRELVEAELTALGASPTGTPAVSAAAASAAAAALPANPTPAPLPATSTSASAPVAGGASK